MARKMTTSLLLILAVGVMGGLAFVAAGPPDTPTPVIAESKTPADVAGYLQVARQIRWRVSGEGRLEVAGLLRFEVDDNGKAIAEVRPDASFDSDPVVALKLAASVDADGQLSLVGLERIGVRGDRIILIADINAAATKEDEDCHMRKPINCSFPYCQGHCNLGLVCGWKVSGGDLICACVPDEN